MLAVCGSQEKNCHPEKTVCGCDDGEGTGSSRSSVPQRVTRRSMLRAQAARYERWRENGCD